MPDDPKSQAQDRFNRLADRYVTSTSHAKGGELDRLLAIAQPAPDWLALDIATGGGHTALKFAPQVRRMIAADIGVNMLAAARQFITSSGAANVTYAASDAEHLAFATNTFDLVTCRIAPHHFPDVFRFITECARVLKPGGYLLIQDHVLPEDERDGKYVDAFERLRDPSHNRAYAEYEWRGLYLDAGLTVEHTEEITKRHPLVSWAERQECTPATIERLQILLKQAPAAVAAWMQPECTGTADASFLGHHLIILGRKP